MLSRGSCLICVQLPAHLVTRREQAIRLAQVIPNLLLGNTKFVREIAWSDEVGHEKRLRQR
ncbi:hypothetical protein ASG71_15840 [Arthrobacter sp. Soil763]|nr:hypothetical protein ASG71_15840 [Arthrobacter sp. Soil763]